MKYLAGIGAVPEEVPEAVTVPTLDRSEASSDLRLAPEDAERALEHYRNDMATFGTPEHAALELIWYTGARLGAIRGLDLDDYEPEENRLRFQHRPGSGTPLKNKREGERYVGLSDDVVAALDTYISRERFDKRDAGGRRPLFSARQGRPSYTPSEHGVTEQPSRVYTALARTVRTPQPASIESGTTPASAHRRGRPTNFELGPSRGN